MPWLRNYMLGQMVFAELQQITIGPDLKPRLGITSVEASDAQLDIDLYKLSTINKGECACRSLLGREGRIALKR